MTDEVGVIESSSRSCGESGLLNELVKFALVVAGDGAQRCGAGWVGIGELGQPGLQQARVEVGEQRGVVRSGVGDSVAVAARDAGDQAVRAQPPQVVADLPGEQAAQVPVEETVGEQPEHQQRLQQGLGTPVTEAEPGDAVPVGGDNRLVYGGEGLGGADRVVAESLDAEQAPVGGEADLPQRGQIGQPSRDLEVAGVVYGGLGPQRPPFRRVAPDDRSSGAPSEAYVALIAAYGSSKPRG